MQHMMLLYLSLSSTPHIMVKKHHLLVVRAIQHGPAAAVAGRLCQVHAEDLAVLAMLECHARWIILPDLPTAPAGFAVSGTFTD